jgi:hypothetical protein
MSLAFHSNAALAAQSNFFIGLDISLESLHGSSSTVDGGAVFAGGGVVTGVKFDEAVAIGGHVGYRIDPAVSVFLSYQHSRSDLAWRANYPAFQVSSDFAGSAISNAVMANLAYDIPLSNALAAKLSAGGGLAFNKLARIVETDHGTGIFLADVAGNTRTTPIARAGAGLRYRVAPSMALGLDGSFAYAGGFATGDTRSGNLGVTAINPYRIDDVWRTNIGASVTFDF